MRHAAVVPALLLAPLLTAGCGGGSSSSRGQSAVAAATSGTTATTATPTSGSTAGSTSATPAAAPTVTGVTPSRAWNDVATTLVVRGSGFVAPAEVRLLDAAGAAPIVITAAVRSATEVEALLPPGALAGVRQVVVSTAAGVSPGAGAPTVTVVGNIDPDVAGGHLVGVTDVQMQGASGDRPSLRIYYPAMVAGGNTPPDPSRGPYPMVAYGHGFKPPVISFGIDHRNNAFIAAWLASFGYVVACPDLATNNQLFGAGATGQANSARDADDLIAALDELVRRGADARDPLFGLVDPTRAALGGHSRGGDGALMAAAREAARTPRRVRAVFALGTPGTDSRNNNVPLVFGDLSTMPALLIGSSRDAIAPVAEQRATLAATRARGVVLEVVGGSHSLFKDNDTTILGDGSAAISLATQHAVVRRSAAAWVNQLVRGQGALAAPWLPRGAVAATDARVRVLDDTR